MSIFQLIITGSTIQLAPPSQFTNLGTITFAGLVSAAIVFLMVITSIILLFILIAGGIAVMVGGRSGNAQQSERGSKAVTAAIIGLIIVFGAWAIITLINAFFGINILSLEIPTAV
jgi:hypothetical protein